MMEANAAFQIELREHDRRINGLHGRIGDTQVTVADHSTEIAVIKRDQVEIRKDIAELKIVVEEEGEKNRASNARVIYALATFALTTAGSAITIAFTLGGHP